MKTWYCVCVWIIGRESSWRMSALQCEFFLTLFVENVSNQTSKQRKQNMSAKKWTFSLLVDSVRVLALTFPMDVPFFQKKLHSYQISLYSDYFDRIAISKAFLVKNLLVNRKKLMRTRLTIATDKEVNFETSSWRYIF